MGRTQELCPSDLHDTTFHVTDSVGNTSSACSGHWSHNPTHVTAVGSTYDAWCQAGIAKRSLNETTLRMS